MTLHLETGLAGAAFPQVTAIIDGADAPHQPLYARRALTSSGGRQKHVVAITRWRCHGRLRTWRLNPAFLAPGPVAGHVTKGRTMTQHGNRRLRRLGAMVR